MSINPGTGRLAALSVTPTPPPAGYCILYFKTDNVLYIQDSTGSESPIGSADSITSLTGDVIGNGPGATATTVVQVGGASAANIASAVAAYLASTSANTPNTLVKRDGSGNIAVQNLAASGTVIGSNLSGTNTGNVTIGTANGLSLIGQIISLALSSGSTNGALSSTDWTNFNSKVADNDSRLSATNVLRVKKNPGTGEFLTIESAMASITTNSITNPFTIEWNPGVYVINNSAGPLVLKSYVSVQAVGQYSVVAQPQDATKDLFLVNGSEVQLNGVIIESVTSAAGVRVTRSDVPFIIDHVKFIDCKEHLVLESTSFPTYVSARNIRHVSGPNTEKFSKITALSGEPSVLRMYSALATEDDGSSFDTAFYLTGDGARIDANTVLLRSTTGTGNGITLRDGAAFYSQSGTEVDGFDINLWSENVGLPPIIRTIPVMLRNSVTNDIQIDHVGTLGSLEAKANTDAKVVVVNGAPIKLVLTDPSNTNATGIFIKGDILQADQFDRRANLSLVARKATTLGVVSGGAITSISGLQINVALGKGFLDDPIDIYLKEINWVSTNITLSANSNNYIYVDTDANIVVNTVLPSLQTVIPLGRVVTRTSALDFIEDSELSMVHIGNKVELILREGLGPIFGTGAIVTENVTPLKLDVSGGVYFYGSSEFQLSGGAAVTWETIYRNGSGDFVYGTASSVSNTQYDNGSGTLASITATFYAKHTMYVVGDSGNEKYFLVYAQAQHATLVDAQNEALPIIPTFMEDAVVRIAGIIVQQGQPNINSTVDLRPRIGFAAPATTAASDHGNLTGLLDDDHPQYLIRTGIRPMTGSLTVTDTTQSTDKDTGSIITEGGVGVEKNINAGGNINAVGTVTGSNLSGTNTGNVTISDTNSIDLSLSGQLLSADLKLSSDAADSGNLKATTTVHSGGGAGLHVEYPYDVPVQIGTSNFIGASSSFSLSDHVHSHGNQTSGTLHAAATTSVNGFMSSTDKTKLDNSTASNTASTLVLRDGSGNFAAGTITANLTGNVSGTSATFTGNLTGDVTSTAMATTIATGAVTDTKSSLAVKPAVTVVSVANLALSGTPTIDGQATAAGSVILLTAQTTTSQNGPWVAAAGAWTRPTWYPSGGTTQAFQFITTFVRLGTLYQGTTWRQTTAGPIIIDTSATTWAIVPLALNASTVTGILPNANTTGSSTNVASALALRDANGNIASGVIFPTTTKVANYTVTAADGIIFCDTSGGSFTITMPPPASSAGKWFRVIDTKGTFNTNNLTLARSATEKISGLSASKVLQTAWGFFNITCDGTDFYVG